MNENEDLKRAPIKILSEKEISEPKKAIKILKEEEKYTPKQAIRCYDPKLNLDYAVRLLAPQVTVECVPKLFRSEDLLIEPTKTLEQIQSIVRAEDSTQNEKRNEVESDDEIVTKVEFKNFILYVYINDKPKKAGNVAFKIIDRITKRSSDDGKGDVIFYSTELHYFDSFEHKEVKKLVKVSANEIVSSRWIEKNTGGAKKIQGEIYAKYLDFLMNIPSGGDCTEFLYAGWHSINDKLRYIIKQGIIGEMRTKYYANDRGFDFDYIPDMVGKKEIFYEIMKLENITRNKSNARTILIFTNLAVMQRIFIESGTRAKFLMAIIGPTNSRKTSCIWPLTKIFDCLKENRPMIQFNSTQKALEEAIASAPDSVIPLDDIQENTQKAAVDLIVRIIGDGQQKKRSEQYETIKREVTGLPIVTGESIKFLQLSSITRILKIEIDRMEIQNEWLDYFSKQKLLMPTYIYDFILYLTSKMDFLINTLCTRVEEHRRHYFKRLSVGRYAENLAFLEVVVETFFNYAVDRQFLTKQEADAMALEYNRSIHEVISQNSYSLGENDYKNRIFLAVHETLRTNMVKKFPLNQENVDESEKITEDTQNTTVVAFEDEKFFFIRAETIHEILKTELDEMGKTLTTKEIIDTFLEFKLLESWEKNRNTMKLPKIKGHQKRYLAIKKAEFDFIVNRFIEEK